MSKLTELVSRTCTAAHAWVDASMTIERTDYRTTYSDVFLLLQEGHGYLALVDNSIGLVKSEMEFCLGLEFELTSLLLCRDHVRYEIERLEEIWNS